MCRVFNSFFFLSSAVCLSRTVKEKYGSDADTDDLSEDESDSESDESEDEDGEELTPALDVAILRTLARIKARDPDIYDASRNVFEGASSRGRFLSALSNERYVYRRRRTEEHGKSGTLPSPARRKKKTKEDKPLTLPEQRLAAALDDASSSRSPSPPLPPTHTEEQAALRAETIAAFHASADADGEVSKQEMEEGGLFTLREKTRDEVEQEEAEYRAYLEREVGPLEKILDLGEEGKMEGEVRRQEDDDEHTHPAEAEAGKKKKKKKKGGKSGEERKETDQEFLIKCVRRFSSHTTIDSFFFLFFRSYILNRGWVDRSARRLPTYKELTAQASSSKEPGPSATHTGAETGAGVNNDLLEEDEFDEVAEHFESSYNFRFEEPDAANIQSFPRAVESVRRRTEQSERRRAARERRQERKQAEKAQRREEVKRLKGLKTRELEAKLERIGKEGGWTHSRGSSSLLTAYTLAVLLSVVRTALQALDLDGDWDAKAHDLHMAAMLVETDGAGGNGDDEKPTWDDDIDIDYIVPQSEKEARHASTSLDGKDRKKEKKNAKKKARDVDIDGVDVEEMDADALQDDGNKWSEVEWDGTEEMRKRVLDQYMEELYGLEFNDMVCLLSSLLHAPHAHTRGSFRSLACQLASDITQRPKAPTG